MLKDWDLDISKLVAITSDAGSNMVKAAELGNWRRFSCFGHCLHSAVNSALSVDDKIPGAIASCRAVSCS